MKKEITLNHITKIEGHASLKLGIEHGEITKCELSAVEGSRYFEGLVRGRRYDEAHEITSRICGICSCGHVIGAIKAIEDAIGHKPSKQTEDFRKLLILGERIRSHATHLYFLSLPDYLGYESALAMASKYKKELNVALSLIRSGNSLVSALGGREMHPVSADIGGWHKLPDKNDLEKIRDLFKHAKRDAIKTADLFFGLRYPDFASRTHCMSLVCDDEYPSTCGRITCAGKEFEKAKYKNFITEKHEARSTANFVVKDGHRYLVGALSRLNNNSVNLKPGAQGLLQKAKMSVPRYNPFLNNVAQAIELMHSIEQVLEIVEDYIHSGIVQETIPDIEVKAGTGIAVVEVPRGVLWHEYSVNEKGTITNANIITPTAQNLLNMQEDIRDFVPGIIKVTGNKGRIVLEIEKLIRAYDPCFSCSAHFLEVNWI